MTMTNDDVYAVSLESMIAITHQDIILDIDTLFDDHGHETDDHEQAVIAIARHPNGKWWKIDLTQFGSMSLH